jgi:hypothetical protein
MKILEMAEIQATKMLPILYGFFALFILSILVEGNLLAESLTGAFSNLSVIALIAFPLGYSKTTLKNWRNILWNIVLVFPCLFLAAHVHKISTAITGVENIYVFMWTFPSSLVLIFIITGIGVVSRKRDEARANRTSG